MKTIAFILCWIITCGITTAADPVKLDLFKAGENGYETYRIPGIIVTPKGSVLAYCEARKNGINDWGAIDVVWRRSTDFGKTFSEMQKITPPANIERSALAIEKKLTKPGELTINNPVMISDAKNGLIHFMYCIDYARCFHMISSDDGQTFGPPVEITKTFESYRAQYAWRVIATGPGHGILTTKGRLIIPVWLSASTKGAHRPSAISTIYSDDAGKTWQAGDIVASNSDEITNPSETLVVELSDGTVMLNIRHESANHQRAVSISKDGATNWSKPRFDSALYEPVCMAALVKDAKGRLIFANPAGEPDVKPLKHVRKNLAIKLSEDDGKTWKSGRLLEGTPAGYSDLAVLPNGEILCFYECGGAAEKPTYHDQLRLARFDAGWITGK